MSDRYKNVNVAVPLTPFEWKCIVTVVLSLAALIGLGLLLTPSVSSYPPGKFSQSSNNLKQIGLAMHVYRDAAGVFPARAIFSPEGKPLLSWRVTLLPYLGGAEVYKEFHLDEPWDSPHNLTLLDRMPEPFRNPSLPSKTKTNYLAVVGPGTIFDGDAGPTGREITDDPASTIMVIETDHAVPWTRPEEWTYDAAEPRKSLGKLRPGGNLALMADGSVRQLKNDVDVETIRGLMTKSGGEKVNRD